MTHLKGGKEVPESKDEEEDSEEGEHEGALKAFEGNIEECKLVLVVRTDLGMGKGMLCSHAELVYPPIRKDLIKALYSSSQARVQLNARTLHWHAIDTCSVTHHRLHY